MKALLIIAPLLLPAISPERLESVNFEQRVERACQLPAFDGHNMNGERVFIRLAFEFPLHPHLHTHTLEEISDLEWLTNQSLVCRRIREFLIEHAPAGVIVLYRATPVAYEKEGKQLWRVTLIYDF